MEPAGISNSADEPFDRTDGVVAILNLSGNRAVGDGFVVSSSELIATCARVFETGVFGTSSDYRAPPKVRFKVTPEQQFDAQVMSDWFCNGEAVVIIRLIGDLPAEVIEWCP